MEFEIELRPHIGHRIEDGVEIEVEQNQYFIIVTGEKLPEIRGKAEEHIGYVGKNPGAPINYLKVALAFGKPTLAVFDRMIRAALIEKAKQRIAQAKADAAEAEKLKAEVEALAAEEKELESQRQEVRAAVAAAEGAVKAAEAEIREATILSQSETAVERKANHPDPVAVEEIRKAQEKVSSGTSGVSEEADSQNL